MAKYSDARNVQLVIALLKKYGIRNVICISGYYERSICV